MKQLPSGIENFVTLRKEDYYYADKTMLIKELLEDGAYVSLFTRPRRFGKSLTMSMLRCFFEVGTDPHLFDGLAISREKELCEKHMGKYPVISISLKTVDAEDFETGRSLMYSVIKREADRFAFLENSEKLDFIDKQNLRKIRTETGKLEDSLYELSRLLYKHYDKMVIILIDEYDVPLDKAYKNGYYNQMVRLVRVLLSSALKTNDYLRLAVVTGCLRISKESIFTGLNNFSVNGITDAAYDEAFGFTDQEVRDMLCAYGLEKQYGIIKEWYDGYRFGNEDIYCPWDVVNFVRALKYDSNAVPENFWANTSDNNMIIRFADMADDTTRSQIGALIEGKSIKKKLRLDLTYSELDSNIENLWSVLFTTGYLSYCGRDASGNYELVIPNREITNIFSEKIDEWFTKKVLDDSDGLKEFFSALESGNAETMEDCLNDYMAESISYLEGGKVNDKENFYHGLLIGMLKSRGDWEVSSNREAGNGRPDIIVRSRRKKYACIIEVKYTKVNSELERKAQEALEQIEIQKYDQYFGKRKIDRIMHCGISFCKKECRVLVQQADKNK